LIGVWRRRAVERQVLLDQDLQLMQLVATEHEQGPRLMGSTNEIFQKQGERWEQVSIYY
jgi:hypothetical protein